MGYLLEDREWWEFPVRDVVVLSVSAFAAGTYSPIPISEGVIGDLAPHTGSTFSSSEIADSSGTEVLKFHFKRKPNVPSRIQTK